MNQLDEYIGDIPERLWLGGGDRSRHQRRNPRYYLPQSHIDFGRIKSCFSVALHMHQPLIPAGGGDLQTAALISNLQYMMDNQGIGDNHNAPVFVWCYKRIGELVPELVDQGKNPRVMLEYSGTLLHGSAGWARTT